MKILFVSLGCDKNLVDSEKMLGMLQEKGYTLVPLQVYFKGSLVKVEIGLARGKKLYDKREDIAKKDMKRTGEGIQGEKPVLERIYTADP